MEEKIKKDKGYVVVQVPTQHTIAIETPEGEIMSTEHGIAEILNQLRELKRELTGK